MVTRLLITIGVVLVLMALVTWTPLKKPWKVFAKKLGVVNSTIILTVFFAVFMGLYSILLKLGQWVVTPFRRPIASRWTPFLHNQNSIEECKRQF
jgi:hypothetical protein